MKNLKLTLILFMTFVLGVCSAQDATIEFVVDMNGVDQPSADYALVTVNGSWNGWTGFGAELFDADADGVYTGSLEIEAGTTFEYVVAVSGEADGYSGWGLQWGDGCGGANVVVTAGAAGSVTTTTLTPGCADVLGCMDVNATNYDAAATAQAYDVNSNLSCIYASCDDIPDAEGCIYADAYASFYPGFGPVECVNYGGTACTVAILGCLDVNASNYDAAATEQAFDQYGNFVCIYASCDDVPEYGCIYADGFGAFSSDGTFTAAQCIEYGGTPCEEPISTTATIEFVVDMNGVDQPSADYALVTVNGSWNGWTGFGAELFDADADGVYTGSLEIEAGTTFEYVVAVSGEADGYSGWGLQWGDGCGGANVVVTAGAAGSVTTTTLTPGCADVLGCMDVNATNYDAAATAQAYDVNSNLSCIYASCDDIPDAEGCIYADAYASFYPGFGPVECVNYGGTACTVAILGCLDVNASNYDAAATEQAFDQYGNFVCIYASCDDVPEYGCIYADGFGAFSSDATFTAAQCIEYGGTPCEEPAGCTDPLFVEFDPTASVDDGSCSVFVVEGCVYTDADNYDVSANTDDGSCLFTLGSTCPGDFTGDGFVNVSDLGGFLGAFGNACE